MKPSSFSAGCDVVEFRRMQIAVTGMCLSVGCARYWLQRQDVAFDRLQVGDDVEQLADGVSQIPSIKPLFGDDLGGTAFDAIEQAEAAAIFSAVASNLR